MRVDELQSEIDVLERRIKKLHEASLKLRLDIMNAKAALGDGMPKGSGDRDIMAMYAAEIDELNRKMNSLFKKRDKKKILLRKLQKKLF